MLGSLKGRDFLSLKDYSKEEIYGLLKFAAELRKDNKKYLKGKVLGMIFAKNSTRTGSPLRWACWSSAAMPSSFQIGTFSWQEERPSPTRQECFPAISTAS